MNRKNILVVILSVVLLIVLTIVYLPKEDTPGEETVSTDPIVNEVPEVIEDTPVTINPVAIGQSVAGRTLEAYQFGTGETHLLFVGGIHGGYEWNSILLAEEMINHFASNTDAIPDNLTVHIIPNLNPDGLHKATGLEGKFSAGDIKNYDMHTSGAGRLNANQVDLNRNFACKWQPTGTWRSQSVSAGTQPFSEPEAQALRNYINSVKPKAVVFWHSMAGNVYASECEDGILPETLNLMKTYAKASGYGEVPSFDAYPVTGDAEGWLASIGIPAITVELKTRTSIEWNNNLAGTLAVLKSYQSN